MIAAEVTNFGLDISFVVPNWLAQALRLYAAVTGVVLLAIIGKYVVLRYRATRRDGRSPVTPWWAPSGWALLVLVATAVTFNRFRIELDHGLLFLDTIAFATAHTCGLGGLSPILRMRLDDSQRSDNSIGGEGAPS